VQRPRGGLFTDRGAGGYTGIELVRHIPLLEQFQYLQKVALALNLMNNRALAGK
jgi:hypothetical protein